MAAAVGPEGLSRGFLVASRATAPLASALEFPRASPTHVGMKKLRFVLALCLAGLGTPALAVDPLYEPQLEHLSQLMGSLYFLTPLCQPGGKDWRIEMSELIASDNPDNDRRQRLAGAFNDGYQAYARLYRECTASAHTAMTRLITDAEKTARDIHAHYAE
ncbi:MAG TPA: TIGR02301 family protein [Devosiaceae bacterium]|nr:TIGR02301 family protein [Devosiaceae bacterium]